MKTTNKFKTQEFFNYLDRMGVKYSVDYNPSPEKIAEIRLKIERNEKLIQKPTLNG